MQRLLGALLALATLVLFPFSQAKAADEGFVVATCGTVPNTYPVGRPGTMTLDPNGTLCVNAAVSVSASITGWPGSTQTTGTPIAVTTGGATGTLPAGTVVVATNVGATNIAYCKLGASATTSDVPIFPNSAVSFTVGSATQLTCITSTSTTTVNMAGGAGLPTGWGGGGSGGSGGSSAITSWGGGTLGAMQNYGTSPGPVLVPGMNAFVTNTVTTTGAGGTFPSTQSGTWTVQPGNTANTTPWLMTIRDAAGNARGANVNALSQLSVSCDNGCSSSTAITSWAGSTLGAISNYGTSPGPVIVPSVNAFVTNVNPNGQATMANSSPVVIASDQSAVTVTATGLAQGSTTSMQQGGLVMAAVTTGAPTYTTAQTNPLSLTTAGDLRTVFSNTTLAVTNAGTFAVQAAQSTAANLNATVVGTGTFATQAAITPVTTGGTLVYTVQPGASDNHAVIKNGAGQVYGMHMFNNSATINYVRLYNAGTGFNGCNSATGLIWSGHIPASTSDAGFVVDISNGIAFGTGISICVTGAYGTTSTTAATASAIDLNVLYK